MLFVDKACKTNSKLVTVISSVCAVVILLIVILVAFMVFKQKKKRNKAVMPRQKGVQIDRKFENSAFDRDSMQ